MEIQEAHCNEELDKNGQSNFQYLLCQLSPTPLRVAKTELLPPRLLSGPTLTKWKVGNSTSFPITTSHLCKTARWTGLPVISNPWERAQMSDKPIWAPSVDDGPGN